MNIDELHKMWDADAKIDEVNLDDSSIKTASLHSKYLELYSLGKLRLKKKELKKAVLKKDLWLYYNGKMTKAEMDKHDWKYDPFDGLSKPMKSDMEKFYSTDSELLELELLLEYDKTYVETCKEILDNIKWRSQTIKNIITWRQFQSGN